MNKAELIAAIDRQRSLFATFGGGWDSDRDALDWFAELAEQLDDPPAMAWQQPDRAGWAYVLCDGYPSSTPSEIVAYNGDGKYSCAVMRGQVAVWHARSVLVCYIPDPPPLPEQERAKP